MFVYSFSFIHSFFRSFVHDPGGVDFEAVNETLLFPNGSVNGATACVDVVILDNSVFGKTRLYFWLHIILIERNVVAHISQAFIHIIDNDGKLQIFW